MFAVAKLLETGLVNLPRVEVLWKPVTAHLLEVSSHQQSFIFIQSATRQYLEMTIVKSVTTSVIVQVQNKLTCDQPGDNYTLMVA